MESNTIKIFTDRVMERGYRISPDNEGQIRIADNRHGLVIMRVTNVGKESIFELTQNDLASDSMVEEIMAIFNEVMN